MRDPAGSALASAPVLPALLLAGCFATDPGPLRVRWDGWEIGPLGNATVRMRLEHVAGVDVPRFETAATGMIHPSA